MSWMYTNMKELTRTVVSTFHFFNYNMNYKWLSIFVPCSAKVPSSSLSSALGLDIAGLVCSISRLCHIQRWASRLWYCWHFRFLVDLKSYFQICGARRWIHLAHQKNASCEGIKCTALFFGTEKSKWSRRICALRLFREQFDLKIECSCKGAVAYNHSSGA